MDVAEAVPLWNGLSITTLALAAAGFLASGWALWQTYKRDHPKVHWVKSWDNGDAGTTLTRPAVRFRVHNRGQGLAQDVRLSVIEKGRDPEEIEYSQHISRAFNEGMEVWLSLTSARAVISDNAGVLNFPQGEPVKKDVSVKVTWSQAPDLHRRPAKVWKYRGE